MTGTAKIWSYPIGRSLSSPSIVDGLLYIADTFEGLYCFDAETGKKYWFHPTGSEVWGSTMVADGKVYLGTKKSLLVLAAGKEKKLLANIHLGTPAYCTPVVANGVLYVASQHYLWAVQANARVASGTNTPTRCGSLGSMERRRRCNILSTRAICEICDTT